ncbi:MAG: hypothetical protein ABI977_13835 [Acidobacteriota bacterium]
MKSGVGLWIDHRQAVIVTIAGQGEEVRHIESNVEKPVLFSGGSPGQAPDGPAEDQQDRRYAGQLSKYYDEVAAFLGDAKSILLFGPGEAKIEFEKHLEKKGFGKCIVATETVDKITGPQIAAKVRQHFLKRR